MINYVTVERLASTNQQPFTDRRLIMMPLSMAKTGETVTIRRITGKDGVRQHLAELGFAVDAEVTVVNEIAGNLILQVKDSRVALDRGLANRVMI